MFAKNGNGLSAGTNGASTYEPLVWTVSNVLAKGEEGSTTSEKVLQALKDAKVKVLEPSETEFSSQVQQATRKGEKAYHVKAFRGSKDGMLDSLRD